MTDEQQDAVPLAAAAEVLGLSTEAVRKRIQRGTLSGHKVNGAWFVNISALPSGRPEERVEHPDDSNQLSGHESAGVRTRARTPTTTQAVDLTPLVDMIERLQGENQRLAEAATAWQFRARTAEERLAALEGGEQAVERENPTVAANIGPQGDEMREMGNMALNEDRAAPQPASESLLRRVWRVIKGG